MNDLRNKIISNVTSRLYDKMARRTYIILSQLRITVLYSLQFTEIKFEKKKTKQDALCRPPPPLNVPST